MLKKLSLVLLLLLPGCATNFTNLTPQHPTRNADNLYPVEVAFNSNRQALRWDSIRPQIMVGNEYYQMRPTMLMQNRWEGVLPVPPGTKTIKYRYKFDFECNSFGKPKADTALSQEYTLQIMEK
jgi:hypothetical protein